MSLKHPQLSPRRGAGAQTGQGAVPGCLCRGAQRGDAEQAVPDRHVGREGAAGPHSGTRGTAAGRQRHVPRMLPTSTLRPGQRGTRGGQAPLLPPVQRQNWAPSACAGSPAPAGPAAPPVPPTSRRAGPRPQPHRGAFLVPCLCFLFSAFVLPSSVLCSSLSFVLTPLVSLPFDALSLPSSWCFSVPGFLSWRLFSLSPLCAWHFHPFSCPVLSSVTWARPGLSSNPHLSCFGAWISLPLCPFLRDS